MQIPIKYPIEYSAFEKQIEEHVSFEVEDKINVIEIHFMAEGLKEEDILILRWAKMKMNALIIQAMNRILKKHKYLLNSVMSSRLDINYKIETPTNTFNFTIFIKFVKRLNIPIFSKEKIHYAEIYATDDQDLFNTMLNHINKILDKNKERRPSNNKKKSDNTKQPKK